MRGERMGVSRLEKDSSQLKPHEYLAALNETGLYAMTRGAPMVVRWHITFMKGYIGAWLDNSNGQEDEVSKAVTDTLFGACPKLIKGRIAKRLSRAKGAKPGSVFYVPVYIRILLYTRVCFTLLVELVRSVLGSTLDLLRAGVRGIPPLIAAVVVVFVTSDAWKVFGSGLTARFCILVILLLLASCCFLVHWDPWRDLGAKEAEAVLLLAGIKHKNPMKFYEFTRRGIQIMPIARPRGLSALFVRVRYWAIALFAVMVFAGLVSAGLILIGVILISYQETKDLAGSVQVWWRIPDGAVVTRQLLSLSLSLGALAPLFLVAAQRPGDRDRFMKNLLIRHRRALLVYSIYGRAQAYSGVLTEVQAIPQILEDQRRLTL
jgi:hypothetical protein